GTKRPPPSRSPGRLRSTASLKLTRSAGLRVLVSCTCPPRPAPCRSAARPPYLALPCMLPRGRSAGPAPAGVDGSDELDEPWPLTVVGQSPAASLWARGPSSWDV